MKRNQFKRMGTAIKSVLGGLLLAVSLPGFAQSCPVNSPPMDVLLFLDNSGSISNTEFDAAQQAIANIATNILARPGYRLAVVNWACQEAGTLDSTRDGCRIDLATGSAIPGGWSSNPADFAYAGNNSASNRVCRSFGNINSGDFLHRNNCGGANFTNRVSDDYAQHALKLLDAALYSSGGTGGTDSSNMATVAPVAPTQRLMLIHMTDANAAISSRIREVPTAESALGNYYYSNRFKNQRNALMVGVGIDGASSGTGARMELGAVSSRGGNSTDYDTSHQTAASTAAVDIGTPRLATFSATFNAAQILAATTSALNATIPACVVMRKQSVGGVGSFNFTGGTNGLPSSLTLTTAVANTPVASPAYTLSGFNTNTGIQETIPSGWAMSGASCVNASNASVPVTSNPTTGQITIPGAQITAGARLTCTVTNTRVQPDFGTCDARMFLEQTNAAFTVNTLYNVGYATAPFTFTSMGTGIPRNGVGYNTVDNYIYGIEWGGGTGNELIRVGADGSGVNLGVITGLPVSNYNNGVISPAGDYYVTDPNNGGSNMYRINLNTRAATLIPLSRSINVSDITWYSGSIWGIDNSVGGLISINPTTGAVTTIGSSSPVNYAISMWGFSNGLFAGTDNMIYAVDPATGTPTLMSTSPSASNADGANCPGANIQFNADLAVTKTNTPASGPNDLPTDTFTPGETRTYSIVVTNLSGSFGAQNITVSDPVPAGIDAGTVSWTCANTSGGSRCGAASGTGALNDTRLDLPSGAVATYLVTMTVPTTFTGDLSNTVTVTPGSATTDPNLTNNTATDIDTRAPQLRLQKSLPTGRAVAADQFTLNMTGMASLTTTGADNTATGVLAHSGAVAGTAYTLSETAAAGANLANYTTTYSCTNTLAGGQTPSGTGISFAVTPVTGDDLTCTLVNTAATADLQIVKTANPDGALQVGQVVTYTLVASNNGPSAANGAVITDTPVGLNCAAPSATATCVATAGASCPGPTVPVSSLTGAGITLPLFPNGGSVTLVMQCTVLPP